MKVGDIYKHKDNHTLIRIEGFASPMNESSESQKYFVFYEVQKHLGKYEKLPICSYYYGTEEEIESQYRLAVLAESIR